MALEGGPGSPQKLKKNLYCNIFVNIIQFHLYCNKTCINYASFITISRLIVVLKSK